MGTRLFIGNLSYNVNEQELREAFSGEGIEVRSVRVALDRDTGRPRGFAFVETATDDGAKASIEKLSGRLMQGRAIIIEEAQAKPTAPRPGGAPATAGAPRPAGFGPPRAPGAGPAGPGAGPGGPPRAGGGFGPPRPPGSAGPPARSGGFGAPRGPGYGGGGGGGSFDPRFQSGGPPRGAGDAPRRERPEKKRSTRPKPEERERGNWRWNGKVDED